MFISSAYFQKYKRFVNESAEVPMAETVAPTSDRMFEAIRYKSLCAEAYKFLTWYGRRHDILYANRPLTGVTITFSRSFVRVTGVSVGEGVHVNIRFEVNVKAACEINVSVCSICFSCSVFTRGASRKVHECYRQLTFDRPWHFFMSNLHESGPRTRDPLIYSLKYCRLMLANQDSRN